MAMPGFGSLMAGRISGYPQALLGMVGMVLTTVFGVRLLIWMLSNWGRLHDPMSDHLEVLGDMWLVLRWAFLGMALFGVSWLWALASSYAIVRSVKNDAPVPPRLT
jgi:ABC-type lipoprotein release transport system permease subunit